jgi:hypothetical protein
MILYTAMADHAQRHAPVTISESTQNVPQQVGFTMDARRLKPNNAPRLQPRYLSLHIREGREDIRDLVVADVSRHECPRLPRISLSHKIRPVRRLRVGVWVLSGIVPLRWIE